MAVLIDPPLWPAHGRRWSHLASDVSLPELHRFAVGLGLPERSFEGDHYDVPEERYAGAVAAGALPVNSRELLRRLQDSGLRRPKRRGERVLVSSPGPGGVGRVDAMLSALPPLGRVTGVHVIVVAGQHLLVLPDDPDGVGYRLPACAIDSTDHPDHPEGTDHPDHPEGTDHPAAQDDGSSHHGSDAARRCAQSLVVALVGSAALRTPLPTPLSTPPPTPPPTPLSTSSPTQVGYLRRVGPGARVADPVVENEVVLRFVVSTPPPRAADGAVWVVAREAVALLAGPVAALAAGASYRLPGRPPGPPVTD